MCAPTGKASLVMQEKTPDIACSTLHRLFYVPNTDRYGKIKFNPSPDNLFGLKLVVIDEASMVGRRVAEEILPMAKRAGVKVLIIGDPGQLPPVKDEEYFFKKPDAMLTEVLRQEAGNPIIALSMAIRQAGEKGMPFQFQNNNATYAKKLFVRPKTQVRVEQLARVIENDGVVIAGTNRTRKSYNTSLRSYLGYTSPTLMEGEKVVIKENMPESEDDGIMVTNGMVGSVSDVEKRDNGTVAFTFTPDAFDGERRLIVNEDILFERKTMFDLRKENHKRRQAGTPELEIGADVWLGYVITAHSSQGSQWKTVYVIDESFCFNRGPEGFHSKNRWLYTAVTRAEQNLVVFV
jgi:exodeoxyribonuclease V